MSSQDRRANERAQKGSDDGESGEGQRIYVSESSFQRRGKCPPHLGITGTNNDTLWREWWIRSGSGETILRCDSGQCSSDPNIGDIDKTDSPDVGDGRQ